MWKSKYLFCSPAESGDLSVSDRDELLRDDRQHFDVDTVELVEATPSPGRREAGEETAHHFVVETWLNH